MSVAVRQRAKFEGWLKFELAACAESAGMEKVAVESASREGTRADLTFSYEGRECNVELKTCNTNWRIEGVLSNTRPITKNIAGVILDAMKLSKCTGCGIVALCLFPVPSNDSRWTTYINRIAEETGVSLSIADHTSRVPIQVSPHHTADVVVVTFVATQTIKG
jgi:hypothetical protein